MGSHRRTLAAAVATTVASFSLYPIFIGMAWFWAGVGATLTVALIGTLTRLRRLPVLVCLLAGVAGLLLYLNDAFESARSLYHLLPTPNSVRLLWDLAGTGFTESAKYAPPVPELPGMLMLGAAGIGLTALLTDLIAVRLESAALAGLPLLLLYTEPFTLSVARSTLGTTVVFCLGIAGYLAMLSSEGKDRIKEWERPNPGPNEIPDTHALATTGRRVGLASVVLALCVPLFIPGLHATRLFGGQPGIGGVPGAGGGNVVGLPDPYATVSSELRETAVQPVLTYKNSNAEPEYLQTYVLGNLTDSGWQVSQPLSLASVDTRLPPPPGMTTSQWATSSVTTVTMSTTVGQSPLGALPVPYPATSIMVAGGVQADKSTLMVFDNDVTLAGLHYAVSSLDEDPTPAVLETAQPPGSSYSQYLKVPQSYQQLLSLIPASVKDEPTAYAKADALQDWLAGGAFKYSLDAPTITDAKGLANFLKTTKTGYCVQFSDAMAVLARLLGIPSRVAIGYTSGSPEGNRSTWLVTTHDGHAWPELYFQGFGWLRFEPTPSGTGEQGTASPPPYTTQTPPRDPLTPTSPVTRSASPNPTSSGDAGNRNNIAARSRNPFFAGEGDNGAGPASARTRTSPWDVFLLALLALAGLLLVLSAAPACAREVIRRRRWRSGQRAGDAGLAHAAWRELRDDLVDYRVGYLPSESPRALQARVGAALELTGPAMAALHRMAMAEERARYASRPDPAAGLRHYSAIVRQAIAASTSRRTRWAARIIPSSVVAPVIFRLIQVTDFSGRLNPDWFGRPRAGATRLGKGWLGREREASAPEDSGTAVSSEPPVGAGARRD